MGVGRGPWPPGFWKFSKKGCFLSFEWEKTNFTAFGPSRKILEKFPSGPSGKNSSDSHVWVLTLCRSLFSTVWSITKYDLRKQPVMQLFTNFFDICIHLTFFVCVSQCFVVWRLVLHWFLVKMETLGSKVQHGLIRIVSVCTVVSYKSVQEFQA